MKHKIGPALIAASLALSTMAFTGCSTTPEQRNMYTCIGITEALNVATANIDKLSIVQVNAIHQAAERVKPICGEGEVPSDDKVKREVLKQAGETVQQILDQVGAK